MEPKNSKVLLVDDFEVVRLMIKTALLDLGFINVEEAANGKIALAKLEVAHRSGNPFDIVFCDWNMPDLSGLDVLEVCRKDMRFSDLPFVMVTAQAEQESVSRALKAGANDYIVKPIAPEALAQKVTRILARVGGRVA
jgi:two-component system, chemotaxis family, chemotaxis protein CheY